MPHLHPHPNPALVLHICVSESDQHWLRSWLAAYSAPSHYLNQSWVIVNWTLRNKLNRNFNQNIKFSFTKMHRIVSSAKWRQFCLGGLRPIMLYIDWCCILHERFFKTHGSLSVIRFHRIGYCCGHMYVHCICYILMKAGYGHRNSLKKLLTQCGLVTPYGDIKLGQNWFR